MVPPANFLKYNLTAKCVWVRKTPLKELFLSIVSPTQMIPDLKGKKFTSYWIHNNGGRPFRVDDYPDAKLVVIYPRQVLYEDENGEFDEDDEISEDYLLHMQYLRIFPGIDPDEPDFLGNSILLEISYKTYYCIESTGSFLFKTQDTIEEYYSPVGNSDVPYPFALGNENVYLIIEDAYTSRDHFKERKPKSSGGSDMTQDPYATYYKFYQNEIVWKPFHNSYHDMAEKEGCMLQNYSSLESKVKELELKLAHLENCPGSINYNEALSHFEMLRAEEVYSKDELRSEPKSS